MGKLFVRLLLRLVELRVALFALRSLRRAACVRAGVRTGVHRGVALAPACALSLLGTVANAAPAAHCPGPATPLQQLAPDVWLLPGAAGVATASNRGHVANLLLVREGRRLWLLGSGPSPAFARALDCRLRTPGAMLGGSNVSSRRGITDVVNPRARAELALGNAGLPKARHWALAEVAQAMQRQCPTCVARLREQLGERATDLGRQPIHLPTRLLRTPGSGRDKLGPFDWQRVVLGPQHVVSVWRHRASGITAAWGLLWLDGPPDGRDADIALMAAAVEHLTAPKPTVAFQAPTLWVGEQGAPTGDEGVAVQAQYWRRMWSHAQAGVAAGLDLPDPPADLLPPGGAQQLGLAAAAAAGQSPGPTAQQLRHALNWQRAWRQAEDAFLAAAPRR